MPKWRSFADKPNNRFSLLICVPDDCRWYYLGGISSNRRGTTVTLDTGLVVDLDFAVHWKWKWVYLYELINHTRDIY
jgi:hypothetical protein